MSTWPGVSVKHKAAKKRGGGSYSQWVVEAKTTMPCGQPFREVLRGTDLESMKAAAEAECKRKARRHAVAHGCAKP